MVIVAGVSAVVALCAALCALWATRNLHSVKRSAVVQDVTVADAVGTAGSEAVDTVTLDHGHHDSCNCMGEPNDDLSRHSLKVHCHPDSQFESDSDSDSDSDIDLDSKPWVWVSRSHDVDTYVKTIPNSPLVAFRGVTIMEDIHISSVMGPFADLQSSLQWVSMLKKVEKLPPVPESLEKFPFLTDIIYQVKSQPPRDWF